MGRLLHSNVTVHGEEIVPSVADTPSMVWGNRKFLATMVAGEPISTLYAAKNWGGVQAQKQMDPIGRGYYLKTQPPELPPGPPPPPPLSEQVDQDLSDLRRRQRTRLAALYGTGRLSVTGGAGVAGSPVLGGGSWLGGGA
jgi:hypothetical protein